MQEFGTLVRLEVMMAAFDHPDVKDATMAGKDLTDEHIAFGFRAYFAEVGGIEEECIPIAVAQYRKEERQDAEIANFCTAILGSFGLMV